MECPSPRVVRDPIKGELLHRFHQHGIFQRPATGPVLYLEGVPVQVDRVGHHAHVVELEADKPIPLKGTTDDSKARTDLCLASSRSVPAWPRHRTELEALAEGDDPIKVVDVSVHTVHHG
jgi:hypothetical protein